jgi:CHAT domain-containing protein/Tfp pilus assembly protein PilF
MAGLLLLRQPPRTRDARQTAEEPFNLKGATWDMLHATVERLTKQGHYEEAVRVAREALKIAEEKFGPDHPKVAISLNDLAEVYRKQARYAEAEPLYKRMLVIREKTFGPSHPDVAESLNGLAGLYGSQGKYVETELLYKQALAIREKTLGKDHPDVAESINGLAVLYRAQGRYKEAEPLFSRALAIREKALGPDHPDVARSLNSVAGLYGSQGKYIEAEPLYRRALAILEKALGPDHPDVADSLNGLAGLYHSQSKYSEAEPLYRRALAIREKALGPDHPSVATSLGSLAELYHSQGKYAEAEPFFKRALVIREKALGPDHPSVATSLGNLASLYRTLGRYEKADPLYRRALVITEKSLGPDHPSVAFCLNNLVILYINHGKYVDAEPLARRSLAISEKAFGWDHPKVAESLLNLARLYSRQDRYSDAEFLYRRALTIYEKSLGPDHPVVTFPLNNLSVLYREQGKPADGEPLARRSLTIAEKALGPDHPHVAAGLTNLAVLEIALDRPKAALPLMRRTLLIDDHTIENVFSFSSEREKFVFLGTVVPGFDMLQNLVLQKLPGDPEAVRVALDAILRRKGLVLEALSREQRLLLTSDNPKAAETAQYLRDTASRLASLTMAGQGKVSPGVLKTLEREKGRLEAELARLSEAYRVDWRSRRGDSDQIARALKPGSVLLEFVGFRMYDFYTKDTKERWGGYCYVAFVLPAGQEAKPTLVYLGEADLIDRAIREFRQEVEQAPELIPQLGEAEAERRLREKGKRVYDLVIAPLRAVIGERDIWYVSPDGELNLIPFEVLPDEGGRYLVETHQVNYLSSGRDLLRFEAGKGTGAEAMVLADPDYDQKQTGRKVAASSTQDSLTLAMHGETQRSVDLRQATWSPLPGTRKEAEAIARELAGQKVRLYLKDQASEEAVKKVKAPRILHLATHGFFLNEQDRSAWLKDTERGLTLSDAEQRPMPLPPGIENPLLRSGLALAGANRLEEATGEGEDDGILTALEISGISLWGTDLVVLSACETGVGETRRGEGVFGLRRAFQLAGARTVVMSLWSVPDEETAALMKDFYRQLKGGTSKAQALREASLGLMRSRREKAGAAHPFYWGAFVSVGEP